MDYLEKTYAFGSQGLWLIDGKHLIVNIRWWDVYGLGSVFCGLRWRHQELIAGCLSSAITGETLTRQRQRHPGHQPHPVIG